MNLHPKYLFDVEYPIYRFEAKSYTRELIRSGGNSISWARTFTQAQWQVSELSGEDESLRTKYKFRPRGIPPSVHGNHRVYEPDEIRTTLGSGVAILG